NSLPVFTITSSALTSATEDAIYSYTVTATDGDGTAPTFAAPTLPSWLSFNASTKVLSGTPLNAHVGAHQVKLTVSDAFGTVDTLFTITVDNVNDAPVFTSTALTIAIENTAYSYTVSSSDADGTTLAYTAPTLPSWLSFDASTKVLSGTPLNADVGAHDVKLSVSDGTVTVDQ
ncbi:uncharacterized protein METZ01_LOCUS505250, partial [marine metagenome]